MYLPLILLTFTTTSPLFWLVSSQCGFEEDWLKLRWGFRLLPIILFHSTDNINPDWNPSLIAFLIEIPLSLSLHPFTSSYSLLYLEEEKIRLLSSSSFHHPIGWWGSSHYGWVGKCWSWSVFQSPSQDLATTKPFMYTKILFHKENPILDTIRTIT